MMFTLFQPYPNLVAAISARSDGSMNVKLELEGDMSITANKERFLHTLGTDISRSVRIRLAHGSLVHIAGEQDAGTIMMDADGLVTAVPNLFLTVTAADCLPIYLYDPHTNIVGLLHAGWRGLKEGIIASGIAAMVHTGAHPSHIRAGIGPGIGVCHYMVPQVEDIFRIHHPDAISERDGEIFLDLKLIATQQLMSAGCLPEHIEAHPDCTHCLPERYFSYRRDRPDLVAPMMAVLGMRP